MTDPDMADSDGKDAAPTESAGSRRPGPVDTWRDFFVQLVIVTLGVLIALFFQGLVDWSRDRALVREARANIHQELQDNLREIDGEIAGYDRRKAHLENCLKFADDLLATGRTDITSIDLGFSLAELSAASWRSAERTGALALMGYRDVQALSKLYDLQDVYVAAQRRALDRVANALTGITGDATKAARADLEAFRREVLALHALLLIENQLAVPLSTSYKNTITELFE